MCVTPVKISVKNRGIMHVSCNKCFECKSKWLNHWSIRIEEEAKASSSAFFLTLTYNDDNLVYGNSYATLVKKDLQDWLKRLRFNLKHNHNIGNVRYYAVGEYGSLSQRPHYHVILFNVSEHLVQSVVHQSWQKGYVMILPFLYGSVSYCLKYMLKKDANPPDTEAPFALFSKGIGKAYLTKDIIDFHKQSPQMCIYRKGNITFNLPRFYRDKIYTSEHDKLILSEYFENEQLKKIEHEKYIAKLMRMTYLEYQCFKQDNDLHKQIKPKFEKI